MVLSKGLSYSYSYIFSYMPLMRCSRKIVTPTGGVSNSLNNETILTILRACWLCWAAGQATGEERESGSVVGSVWWVQGFHRPSAVILREEMDGFPHLHCVSLSLSPVRVPHFIHHSLSSPLPPSFCLHLNSTPILRCFFSASHFLSPSGFFVTSVPFLCSALTKARQIQSFTRQEYNHLQA